MMKKQLDIIQVFRGLAALFVVIHHIVPSLSYFQNVEYPFLNYLASLGKYGVDFFFILSGFIIHYSNAFKKNNNVGKFIRNRIIRIYVPYLPVGIALYFLYQLLPTLSKGDREISTITSFTLFPDGNPALAVAWTLSFEMFFYLIYTLCIINKNVWNVSITLWSATILLVNYMGVHFDSPFLQMVFSYYNLEFLLGYLFSLLIIKRWNFTKNAVIFVILFLFAIFTVSMYLKFVPYVFFTNCIFALFAFFLLYYYLTFRTVQLSKGNLLMIIGNSSYSLYLVHGPLHGFIERFLPISSNLSVFLIYIALVTIICIVAGYVYYFVFEKKAITLFKN